MARRLILLGLVLLLPACDRAATSGRVSLDVLPQLKVDQPESEVVALLGPPAEVCTKDGERTLIWDNGELIVEATFREGKLVSRSAILDGLPVAINDDTKKPSGDQEVDVIPGQPYEPATKPAADKPGLKPGQKYATVFERSIAFATKEPSDSVSDGRWTNGVSDTAADGGVLVGLIVHLDEHPRAGTHISALQPIWLTPKGIIRGKLLGQHGKKQTELLAKRGYAVNAINVVRDRERYFGLSLTFLKIDGDRLDAANRYDSPHVGGKGNLLENFERLVTSREHPIYGFQCHFTAAGPWEGAPQRLDGIRLLIARRFGER